MNSKRIKLNNTWGIPQLLLRRHRSEHHCFDEQVMRFMAPHCWRKEPEICHFPSPVLGKETEWASVVMHRRKVSVSHSLVKSIAVWRSKNHDRGWSQRPQTAQQGWLRVGQWSSLILPPCVSIGWTSCTLACPSCPWNHKTILGSFRLNVVRADD